MAQLSVHTIDSAPDESKSLLESTQKGVGMIPNLLGVFAESPVVLKGYKNMAGLFGQSSLSKEEQIIVYLTVSRINGCDYCMAAHSAMAKKGDFPDDMLAALREGQPLADDKLEVFRNFVQTVVNKNGEVGEDDVQAFLDAGYTKAQILEVLFGVAIKTLTNYTNHIAKTPLDEAFTGQKWDKT